MQLSLRPLSAFLGDTRGAITPGFLLLFPGLILIAGIAIDYSVLNAQRKYVQSLADLGALAGIRRLETDETVRDAARRTLEGEAFFDMKPADELDILLGELSEDHRFVASFDQHSLENVSSVQVVAAAPMVMPILGRFLPEPVPLIRRSAVAAASPVVSFSLSNCLASLHLLRGMLEPMVGANADVLCSGHGIRIHSFQLLDQLALRGSLLSPDTTYGDVLDASFTFGDILTEVMGPQGIPVVTGPLSNSLVRLSDFIYLSDDLRAVQVGNPVPPLSVNVADIVFGSLELLGSRVLDLDLTVDLGPFANVPVKLRISEPRQFIIGATPGDPDAVAQTSQIRLSVDTLSIAGLFDLTLGLNIANAEAALVRFGEHCSANPVHRAAVFDPVTVSLIDLDLDAELLGIPLFGGLAPLIGVVTSGGQVRTAAFTHAEVEAKTVKSFRVEHSEIVDSAVNLLGPVLGGLLGPTARSLSRAVLDDLLGLKLAEAQLEVLDVVCTRRLAG